MDCCLSPLCSQTPPPTSLCPVSSLQQAGNKIHALYSKDLLSKEINLIGHTNANTSKRLKYCCYHGWRNSDKVCLGISLITINVGNFHEDRLLISCLYILHIFFPVQMLYSFPSSLPTLHRKATKQSSHCTAGGQQVIVFLCH